MLGSPRTAGTDAVSHPGWLRSASSAICVSSALLFPIVTGGRGEFFGACLRHAAHAFAGIEPRDGALAQAVIKAVGVAVLDPQPLRRAQLIALRRHCILHRLLVGDVQPLVPLRGLGL